MKCKWQEDDDFENGREQGCYAELKSDDDEHLIKTSFKCTQKPYVVNLHEEIVEVEPKECNDNCDCNGHRSCNDDKNK